MDRNPVDNMVDRTAMLLSTDWFLPYWDLIGLQAIEQKQCIQRGCREIVTELMSAAGSYYHVSFSEKRLDATREQMRRLSRQCQIDTVSEAVFEELVREKLDREEFYKTGWLFRMSIDDLVGDTYLKGSIRAALQRAQLRDRYVGTFDLERACSESSSPWDEYIRCRISEVPTLLSDLVSVSLTAARQLRDVLGSLDQAERENLLSRFRSVAKSFSGLDIADVWPRD